MDPRLSKFVFECLGGTVMLQLVNIMLFPTSARPAFQPIPVYADAHVRWPMSRRFRRSVDSLRG